MVPEYLPIQNWAIFGVNVGVHIPAPWFAYGLLIPFLSGVKKRKLLAGPPYELKIMGECFVGCITILPNHVPIFWLF